MVKSRIGTVLGGGKIKSPDRTYVREAYETSVSVVRLAGRLRKLRGEVCVG